METVATRYVHLSPTVLFPVPDCYSLDSSGVSATTCRLCPVRQPCERHKPTELRMRPVWPEVKHDIDL